MHGYTLPPSGCEMKVFGGFHSFKYSEYALLWNWADSSSTVCGCCQALMCILFPTNRMRAVRHFYENSMQDCQELVESGLPDAHIIPGRCCCYMPRNSHSKPTDAGINSLYYRTGISFVLLLFFKL